MAKWLLSLTDACSASLAWIKLAILNQKHHILHCDLRFTSCGTRGLWHTEAESFQMPLTGHFYKKNVRWGSIHQHPHISCAALPPTCWVLILTPVILSIALHVPSVGKTQTEALQGRAKQSQSNWKPQLMKQEEDYAISLTDEKCGAASYPRKVVDLCNWAEQSRREKKDQKAETSNWVRRQSSSACWASFGNTDPVAWATHRDLGNPQGLQLPADFKWWVSNLKEGPDPAPPKWPGYSQGTLKHFITAYNGVKAWEVQLSPL